MSRALPAGIRLLAGAVALILAVGVLQPRLAAAATATISLNPTSGQAGSGVNVTGSNFGFGETITITFQGFGTVATTTSGASGFFSTSFTVPGAATPASYTVTATGSSTGRTATAQFQVFASPATTLSISKAVSSPGSGLLTYQLSYVNNGPAAATGVVVSDTLQGGQTLQPASLSSGCTYNASTSTVTCVPNPTGTPGNLPPSPSAGSAGAFYFTTQVNCGFSGNINNAATISGTNAATQTSNTTSVPVTAAGCGPGSTNLQKTVEDNNSGFFATSINARSGDVITYDIAYINSSTTTVAPNVTVNDTLQAGQTYLGPPYSSSNCSPIGSSTISCPLGNVPPNTRVDVFISASVNSNVSGATIANQASATSAGTTIFSNTTTVTVNSTSPPPCTTTNSCCTTTNTCCTTTTCTVSGNFVLCGLVTGYTGTSVTVNGVTVAIVPGAPVSGAVAVGTNECITFALNSAAQATALAVSSNLAGAAVACGFYGGTSTSGVISVTGIGIPLAPTANFQAFVVPGAFYCFLLNSAGQAQSVLSGVPTSLSASIGGGGGSQIGEERAL
jgi:uncharacterized repeat protein (TIGR01451 family)